MKKFFTFAAALMASVSMWAVVVPTTTLNPANTPTENWAGKYQPAFIEDGDWVLFSPYEIYQSIALGQTWTAAENSGSTSGSWTAMTPFPAQSAWTTNDGKVATTKEGGKGPYYYRITNTTEVAAIVKSGSNQKRTVILEAFELTAGTPAATAFAADSCESNSNTVISITGLDNTKEYLVVVRSWDTGSKGSSSGNSSFMAIGFKTIMSTDPVLNVNPAEVALNVTASATNPSATVTFSGKNLAAGNYALSVPDLAGLTVSPASVTVGEDGKLNAEVTISYTSAVEVAAASTSVDLTIGALTKVVVVNYSATLAKSYANSINIEQLVVNNGIKYNIASALASANIEYANIDALDSLNNSKGNARNEAYLGLKLKKQGAYMACWIQAGQTIRVKFGNVGANVKVIVNGAEQTFTPAQLATPLEYTAADDSYVKFETTSSATVVVKQIMVNEPITKVMYNIAYSVGEGGTVTGWTVAFPGEDVVMNITSNEGYALTNLTYNGIAMVQSAPGAPIFFTMPSEDVTVAAAFGIATGMENTESEIKAQKRIVNGVMVIEKNGVVYNAQGQIVK